jgi:malate/lactate dehydrogenase
MSTVAILGAGTLGGAVAHALAERGLASRVLLIDPTGQVAAGKALDIQQAGAITGAATHVNGTTETDRAIGCDLCVVADREGPAGEWQHESVDAIARLARSLGSAPLVFAGAGQDALMRALAVEGGVAFHRLVGSASEALAAAIRAVVAMELGCSATEVSLSVLGRPPAGVVVPWVEASIGGYALEKVMSQAQLARVEARVPRLWPPGAYTLGLAAADVAGAMLRTSRRPRSVLSVLNGEFGARRQVGAIPTFLGPSGILRTKVPTLNTRERVQVESALGI